MFSNKTGERAGRDGMIYAYVDYTFYIFLLEGTGNCESLELLCMERVGNVRAGGRERKTTNKSLLWSPQLKLILLI